MPSYDSPLGNKPFQGQPLKEVSIPDESGFGIHQNYKQPHHYPQMDEGALRDFQSRMSPVPMPSVTQEQAELEQQFREAREAKKAGKERLSEGARRRIEMLVGMSRSTRTANIEGNVYTLQTLRSRELREAVVSATEFDGTVQSPFEIRKQLLSRSIVQIAGMDFDQFVGSHELSAKLDAIEEFDHYLLGRLYDEYLTMVGEAREKYAVKDETDAKEVMDDLKK